MYMWHGVHFDCQCAILFVDSVPKSGTGVGSKESPAASAVLPNSRGTSKNLNICIMYRINFDVTCK